MNELDAAMDSAMATAHAKYVPAVPPGGRRADAIQRPAVAAHRDIMSMLNNKKMQAQISKALPSIITADRFMRIILTELRKTPALLNCNTESFLGAMMQCAQLGLDPTNALGQAYLLPFGSGKAKDGKPNCQLIIGYKGMLELARRSGAIQSINVFCVHQKDEFKYSLGLNPDIIHVPSMDAEPGSLTFVYAVVRFKDGGLQFDVMSRAQIEAVRNTSKAGASGPWSTHFEEMAKKTVIRRMFKYLPISIERLQEAIAIDEKSELGEVFTFDPDKDDVIDC